MVNVQLNFEIADYRMFWKFGTVCTEIDVIPGMLLNFFMVAYCFAMSFQL